MADLGGVYTLGPTISRGGMGAVYRGRHKLSGEHVAVKRLLEEKHAVRFEIEARLLARLSHPRVVRVLDHFEQDGSSYLVMDLVKGVDLDRVLQERGDPGLPVDEAVEYARQACEALDYIHGQHVVHRDVKPRNMILADSGIVLVDFGIARELAGEHTGTVIGTPKFMAPEVFGGIVSPRSDVFGLAATLWTLIAGQPPIYGDAASLSAVAPDVPPAIDQAVRGGLELDPVRRIPSAAAMARALGAPLHDAAGGSLAMSVDRPSAPPALLEAVVKAAAGVFEAAASSIALVDPADGELVFQAAWGAGANEIVGVRLQPGEGISGTVAATGEGAAVPSCRSDPRFAASVAASTGYVPNTMLAVPLVRRRDVLGVLCVLDRRDGGAYGPPDLERAGLFADVATAALETGTDDETVTSH